MTTNGIKPPNPLSPPCTTNNIIATNDPLHGLLLGNTTAFDAVTTQQQLPPISTTISTSPTKLIMNGKISQSPFDLDDKEVAESMSCTTNYPLQFEACMCSFIKNLITKIHFLVPNDDVDTVFMPIKSNDDDEPVGF